MYCELWKIKGSFRAADGFCEDCVKYYCFICLRYHSDFLPTHVLKDKKSMPQDFCVKPCLNHEDEIIKFYCSKCDKFFCSLCKQTDHKDCTTVSHLPGLVQGTDLARYLNELKKKIARNLRIVENRENGINLKALIPKECADKAKEDLQSLKNEIIQWLEINVVNIEEEIEGIQTLDEQVLQSECSAMSAFKVVANTVKCGLDSKNPSAERCELFMNLKDYERQQKQIEERLKKERQHTVTRYVFKSSDNLKKLLGETLFGKLAKKASNDKDEVTFSFTVENVSKLKTRVSSQMFRLQNLEWQIVADGMQRDTEVNTECLSVFSKCNFCPYTYSKKQSNSGKSQQSVFFKCNFDTSSRKKCWSCNAEIELRIIDQDDEDLLCRKFKQIFCEESCTWGYNNYLEWNKVLDPDEGYCKDDKIILQAHVIVDPSQ